MLLYIIKEHVYALSQSHHRLKHRVELHIELHAVLLFSSICLSFVGITINFLLRENSSGCSGKKNTILLPDRSFSVMCRKWLTGCLICRSCRRSFSWYFLPWGLVPSRGWSRPNCSRKVLDLRPCLSRSSSIG